MVFSPCKEKSLRLFKRVSSENFEGGTCRIVISNYILKFHPRKTFFFFNLQFYGKQTKEISPNLKKHCRQIKKMNYCGAKKVFVFVLKIQDLFGPCLFQFSIKKTV